MSWLSSAIKKTASNLKAVTGAVKTNLDNAGEAIKTNLRNLPNAVEDASGILSVVAPGSAIGTAFDSISGIFGAKKEVESVAPEPGRAVGSIETPKTFGLTDGQLALAGVAIAALGLFLVMRK